MFMLLAGEVFDWQHTVAGDEGFVGEDGRVEVRVFDMDNGDRVSCMMLVSDA